MTLIYKKNVKFQGFVSLKTKSFKYTPKIKKLTIRALEFANRTNSIPAYTPTWLIIPVNTVSFSITIPQFGDAFRIGATARELACRTICLTVASIGQQVELVRASTTKHNVLQTLKLDYCQNSNL